VPPKYDDGRDFSEGLATVRIDNKWGYINTIGKLVIKLNYWDCGYFSEGLAPVQISEVKNKGKWGFIDARGKMIISPQFDHAFEFSEGVAAVDIGGLWGYIDKTGAFVIEPAYFWADSFSEEVAWVLVNNKSEGPRVRMCIDKSGKSIIPPEYYHALNFKDGLALVKGPKGYGYIDKNNKFVFGPLDEPEEKLGLEPEV
jgi:hypothetical protein